MVHRSSTMKSGEQKPRSTCRFQGSRPAGTCLGFELVDEVDDVVEPAPCTVLDAGPSDGDGEVSLAGTGPADEHDVALMR